jgi:hypothetical protein
VNDVFEEALLRFFRRSWPPLRDQLDGFGRRAADAVRPEPPLFMQTLNGDVVTGVVILERGQALAFLGIRHARTPRSSPHHHYPHYDDEPLPTDTEDRTGLDVVSTDGRLHARHAAALEAPFFFWKEYPCEYKVKYSVPRTSRRGAC